MKDIFSVMNSRILGHSVDDDFQYVQTVYIYMNLRFGPNLAISADGLLSFQSPTNIIVWDLKVRFRIITFIQQN